MRSLEWILIQYNCCPYEKGKFGHRHVHTGIVPSEDESRDQGNASTSQGMPEMASKTAEASERHGTDLSHSPQHDPALPAPWSDLPLPELWDNTFLLFKPPSLWYFDRAALANWCKWQLLLRLWFPAPVSECNGRGVGERGEGWAPAGTIRMLESLLISSRLSSFSPPNIY